MLEALPHALDDISKLSNLPDHATDKTDLNNQPTPNRTSSPTLDDDLDTEMSWLKEVSSVQNSKPETSLRSSADSEPRVLGLSPSQEHPISVASRRDEQLTDIPPLSNSNEEY